MKMSRNETLVLIFDSEPYPFDILINEASDRKELANIYEIRNVLYSLSDDEQLKVIKYIMRLKKSKTDFSDYILYKLKNKAKTPTAEEIIHNAEKSYRLRVSYTQTYNVSSVQDKKE